jgi:hypothetical protein
MKPGELRVFRDSSIVLSPTDDFERGTFIVLKVNPMYGTSVRTVDILLDGGIEEGLGYFWVEDNSEVLNESR